MGEYNPIRRNYCYQHNYKLDIEAMKKKLKLILLVRMTLELLLQKIVLKIIVLER